MHMFVNSSYIFFMIRCYLLRFIFITTHVYVFSRISHSYIYYYCDSDNTSLYYLELKKNNKSKFHIYIIATSGCARLLVEILNYIQSR